MLPIRDHNPSGRTPFVTYALIAINIVVFISYYPFASSERELALVFYSYGVVPQFIISGENWLGLLTSMFLHGGWMHLLGNMLFLYIFGDNIEDKMGHMTYLGFYILTGLAAAFLQIVFDPFSTVPMVGASGAIAGVMGGYLLLYPKARVDILFIFIIFFKVFTIPAWIMLGIWFGMQAFNGVASIGADGGGVAYWAHAGGFIAGMVLTYPLFLRLGGTCYWNRTHGHPPHKAAEYSVTRSGIPRVRRR